MLKGTWRLRIIYYKVSLNLKAPELEKAPNMSPRQRTWSHIQILKESLKIITLKHWNDHLRPQYYWKSLGIYTRWTLEVNNKLKNRDDLWEETQKIW